MKKVFFLMLVFCLGIAASVNAQVRIGGSADPNTDAILDLNATDTTTVGKLGLLLPRVALDSTLTATPLTAHVKGITVYNTKKIKDVSPGVYFNDGDKWIRITGEGATGPVITQQPKAFSWSRLYDVSGDPLYPATATIADLEVKATGKTLTYQWYKKAVAAHLPDTLLTGANTATYTPDVSKWGMNSYYCVVSDANGSVKSEVADVALGCGAKTNTGGWLQFMCHNVGANPVPAATKLEDITFAKDTNTVDVKGFQVQTSRPFDGYQWLGSPIYDGIFRDTTLSVPAPGDPRYGKLIIETNASVRRSVGARWTTALVGPNAAFCPTGWQLPMHSDWAGLGITESIGRVGDVGLTIGQNHVYITKYACIFTQAGEVVTLFLPRSGRRYVINGNYEPLYTRYAMYGTWPNIFDTALEIGTNYVLLAQNSMFYTNNLRCVR
jgi:hypothetical protein